MTVGVGVLSLIGMLLVGALVLGFVLLLVLAVASSRFRAIAIGLLVVPVLLAVGFAFFFFSKPSVHREVIPGVPVPSVTSDPIMVEVGPSRYVHSTSINLGNPPEAFQVRTPLTPPPAAAAAKKTSEPATAKVRVEKETGSGAERLLITVQPADAKGQAAAGSSPVGVEIRTEPGSSSQAAGLLRALASALIKAAAETPSAETAASFVAKVVPESTSAAPAADPAPTRPDWVEASPKLVGDVYQVPLAIGPYESRLECDRRLPAALQQAVDEYVRQDLGTEALWHVRLPKEYMQSHLVSQVWEEKRNVTLTSTEKVPMVLLHVLVTFDTDVKNLLRETWHRVVIFQRLRTVGLALAGVLVLLATFWAYLRIDLATGGAYRNRLRLATALVVVLLAVFAVTLAA